MHTRRLVVGWLHLRALDVAREGTSRGRRADKRPLREVNVLDAPLLLPPDSDSECSFDSFDSAVRRPFPFHGSYCQRGSYHRAISRACLDDGD